MDASRTVLVEHSSRSQGGVSVAMHDVSEDGSVTQRSPMSSYACRGNRGLLPSSSTPVRKPLPRSGPVGMVTTATAAESPQEIERIMARYSRMRTDVQVGDGGDEDTQEEDVPKGEFMDDEEERKEEDDAAVKEVTRKTANKTTMKSHGKSKVREGGPGDGETRGGRNMKNWDLDDSLVLVRCKRDQDHYMADQGSNFARMKGKWPSMRRAGGGGVERLPEVRCVEFTPSAREESWWRWWWKRGGGGGGGGLKVEVDVALRGRVQGRSMIFYEMRHRHGNDYGRDFGFENGVTKHGVPHYEVDEDGDTCLHLTVGYGYGRRLLRQVVIFPQKVGTTIPDRWVGGSDVLADIINLLVSNVAIGFAGHLHEPTRYIVHADPLFVDRSYLHGEVRIIVDDFH
ncbi:hypothetical protein CBR_g3523 [Chara braunii]|uniref:Uncharacterized protein n=1 Tax=Chara braunii TaxID=69332 RepID=A0A388KFL3_CHABU|nr:hypothetical protein CBR_g3523 [Chara braunii]|eukprot:GBG68829.1 hypothetical protein CBR_g3523 [Chara braunii]